MRRKASNLICALLATADVAGIVSACKWMLRCEAALRQRTVENLRSDNGGLLRMILYDRELLSPYSSRERGLSDIELSQAFSGLLVGIVVGFTGVGGGSLMAPILILLLGVAPVTAVGTDLWFAAITKTVGGSVHHARGNADLTIVKRLCIGSIPLAVLTLLVLSLTHTEHIDQGIVAQALGAVLVVTAIATFFRHRLKLYGEQLKRNSAVPFKAFQVPLTIAAGALLGVLVTLTSVGAGALCATILVFLYPGRLHLKKVVGTDILHAIRRGSGPFMARQRRLAAARLAPVRVHPRHHRRLTTHPQSERAGDSDGARRRARRCRNKAGLELMGQSAAMVRAMQTPIN
jgi:uncharacterized membrane protein YfcA